MTTSVSGTQPGQRALNGPQTTGRAYRNLSAPAFTQTRDDDVRVPLRDGAHLLADVHRPDAQGRFPVLVAASPYPRQIQDVGAPLGFIEAGASDFFVPRGYVHVIANLRGTSGSEGVFGFFDSQERQDMYDLVEWAAAQPWCDGNVGMIGISYFAMTQMEAATQRPPHLRAIFPVAASTDLYQSATHHGLVNSSFVSPFLSVIGLTSSRSDRLLRGRLANAARRVLGEPRLHRIFATVDGEAAIAGPKILMRARHDPYPWDDLWRAIVAEHPVRDQWWDERNLLPLLGDVDIPVYLGCDWGNVPLHLPSTFAAWRALSSSPVVRVALLGRHGLSRPWESLHIEALAWFDHWLKSNDTGILDGPPIRYVLPGADGWRAASTWPPEGVTLREFALRADGALGDQEGTPGRRSYVCLGTGLNRQGRRTDPPSQLSWTSLPLPNDLDMIGDIELRLTATSTAIDTAWIAVLQDVDPAWNETDVTAGWLRASLREVDEPASRPGSPELPCRRAQAVPIGEEVVYRIPLAASARRFAAGHRIRLILASDDQSKDFPAPLGFRHGSVGTSTLNTISSSSRLLVPVLGG